MVRASHATAKEVTRGLRGSHGQAKTRHRASEGRGLSTGQEPQEQGQTVPTPVGLGVAGTEAAAQAQIQEEAGFMHQGCYPFFENLSFLDQI